MGIDGGDEKRTRFPCLATVRYMVAAVVAVLTVVVVETSRRRRPSSTIYILMGQTILEKTPGSASHWGGFVSPEHLMPPWASPSGLRGRTPPWVGVDLSDLAVFKRVLLIYGLP